MRPGSSRASPIGADLAVQVPRERAEEARRQILEEGLLDNRRKILAKGCFIEIPVIAQPRRYKAEPQEDPEFYQKVPPLEAVLAGQIPEGLMDRLPRGWFILGDVIIVKLRPEVEDLKGNIGSALLQIYPRCKAVVMDKGIEGQFREPIREIIAGEISETVHVENGIKFCLDARKIMFSQGNLLERIRMGRMGKGETVVDMFAGIGYFTLPMAVHSRPKKITAIELNPVAYSYLKRNIALNHVEDIVEPTHGDCSEVTPVGEADRAIMGYVGTTNRYLKAGLLALRPRGIIHYHQTMPSWLYPWMAVEELTSAAGSLGLKVEVLRCARVKKYSPGMIHSVVDARICRDV